MLMTNRTKRVIPKVCLFAGACLLIVGVLMLVFWQCRIHNAVQTASAYVETLRSLTPDSQGAVPEERRDNTMPVLAIDGTDFVGILEIPRYESSLPVCADWGSVTKYPCRLNGSVYNRTMQIGATTQKGQYDFYRELSVGDTVVFTDMEGNRYTYVITNLRYEKHADQAALAREESALTLFVKNVYDFEYLMVFCDAFQ